MIKQMRNNNKFPPRLFLSSSYLFEEGCAIHSPHPAVNEFLTSYPILPLTLSETPFFDPDTLNFAEVKWTPIGHLRYGTRHVSALTRLKWLSTKYYATFPIPDADILPRRPHSLTQRMMEHIERVAKDMSTSLRVKCELKGGQEKGLLRFRELNGTVVGELNYTSTQRAIEILRGPYDVGIPVGMNRKLLTWHPVIDVSYSGKASKIRSDVVRYIDI